MMRFLGRRTSFRIIGATLVLVAAGATAWSSLVAFGQTTGPGDDPSAAPVPIIEVFDSAQSITSRVLFNSPTDVELLSAGVNQVPAPARIGGPPLIKVELFDINGALLETFNEWHPLLVEHQGTDGSLETVIEDSGEGRFIFPFAPDIWHVMITDIELGQQLIEIDARQIVLDYCAANASDPECGSVPPDDAVTTVEIDIKPGSDLNSINCSGDRVVAIAILTTDDFDATQVDHTTVTFAGASETHVDKKSGDPRRHQEDADGDGDVDLVLHFRLSDTDLTCDSTGGILTGETFDDQAIIGADVVRMIDRGRGPP